MDRCGSPRCAAQNRNERPHLTSWHALVGLTAVLLTVGQVAAGIVLYYPAVSRALPVPRRLVSRVRDAHGQRQGAAGRARPHPASAATPQTHAQVARVATYPAGLAAIALAVLYSNYGSALGAESTRWGMVTALALMFITVLAAGGRTS